MILICISLITKDAKHFFYHGLVCNLDILLEKGLLKSFAYFFGGV